MDKNKDNKKKPLKLSSTGRLQIRKNLGPSGDKTKSNGNKKTIQIVFRNKNNQQKSSSTSQSNFRGSSTFRTTQQISPGIINPIKNKNFEKYLRSLYVSSFGMIGVGLPYAIGAKAALPDKKVILVVGDGSLGFHAPEIDTSVRHDLPVTVVVGNNSLWGIDYWIQKGLYDRDVWTELDQTNYELVAKGFGAGADFVMLGGMLAGHKEGGGKILKEEG